VWPSCNKYERKSEKTQTALIIPQNFMASKGFYILGLQTIAKMIMHLAGEKIPAFQPAKSWHSMIVVLVLGIFDTIPLALGILQFWGGEKIEKCSR
jgi:hypothetical protein